MDIESALTYFKKSPVSVGRRAIEYWNVNHNNRTAIVLRAPRIDYLDNRHNSMLIREPVLFLIDQNGKVSGVTPMTVTLKGSPIRISNRLVYKDSK